MSKVDVVLGLQWGDEGKGKVTDLLTPRYDIVARFQGGGNADHTIYHEDNKYILSTIPSGIFDKESKCVIGAGVAVDPIKIKNEYDNLIDLKLDIENRLFISDKSPLTLPIHVRIDIMLEDSGKGNGSTKSGISPTFRDLVMRKSLRVVDIFKPNFKGLFFQRQDELVKEYSITLDDEYERQVDDFFMSVDLLKRFNIINVEYFINEQLKKNKTVLAEGAQGTMLDVNYGSYPNVTSTNTITAAVCSGLGVSPDKIGKVYGVIKPYLTRVGGGDFITRQEGKIEDALAKFGHEYDVHGRIRKCGWLDIPQLKYAIMINGVTDICLMKTDVLSSFVDFKVCSAYNSNGLLIDTLPTDMVKVEPIYTNFKSWETMKDSKGQYSKDYNFRVFASFLEKELDVPVSIISYGTDRKDIVEF